MSYAKWLFIAPACIHIWWAKCTWAAERTLTTTGLADINAMLGGDWRLVALILLFIGLLGLVSVALHRSHPWLSLLALIPQQAAMITSGATAYVCIRDSHFADFLPYDQNFISADQCYIAIIGIAHTICMIHIYIKPGFQKWINT